MTIDLHVKEDSYITIWYSLVFWPNKGVLLYQNHKLLGKNTKYKMAKTMICQTNNFSSVCYIYRFAIMFEDIDRDLSKDKCQGQIWKGSNLGNLSEMIQNRSKTFWANLLRMRRIIGMNVICWWIELTNECNLLYKFSFCWRKTTKI